MPKILSIISSPRGEASNSIKLSNAIIDKLKEKDPGAAVLVKDLTKTPFPHMEEAHPEKGLLTGRSRQQTNNITASKNKKMPHIHVNSFSKTNVEKVRLAEEITKAATTAVQASEANSSVSIEILNETIWIEKVYKLDILGNSGQLYIKPGCYLFA
jgi:phenylpyruvate tautomerase PptA (4-oxalocrotonate tautomerase family)